MSVWILEMTGVSTPKSLVSRNCNIRSRSLCLFHDLIHFLLAVYIVADGKFSRIGCSQRIFRLMNEIFAIPNSELDTCL